MDGKGRAVTADLGGGAHLTPFDEFTGVNSLRADTITQAADGDDSAGDESEW